MWGVIFDISINVCMLGPVDYVVLVLERWVGPVLQRDMVTHDVDYSVRTLFQWVGWRWCVTVWLVDQNALADNKVGESSRVSSRGCIERAVKQVVEGVNEQLLKAHGAMSEVGRDWVVVGVDSISFA